MSKQTQHSQELEDDRKRGADIDVDREHDPAVSRRASNAGLNREASAIQKKGTDGIAADQVHDAAARGTSAPAGRLPHHDQIQASFGDHDISHVKSHIDGEATSAMGAEAYASGNDVVFGQQPDLHTAAHEAAHVVQQTGGVNLKGGVGQAGDAYEQNADAVADRVVAGEPAGDLLGPVQQKAPPAQSQAVQRKDSKQTKPASAAELHETSNSNSMVAAQSALTLLAKQMHDARTPLEGAMAPKAGTDAGSGPDLQKINHVYETIKSGAENASSLIGMVNKSDVQTLSPDVKVVLGAYTRFQPYMWKASEWMANHQGARVDVSAIKTIIDGYRDRLGFDNTVTLEPNTTVPTGEEKDLSKAMVTNQFDALKAAMDSVKAGNKQDVGRITVELRELDSLATNDRVPMKPHKDELTKFSKALEEIRSSNPDLKDKLAEAHNHLLSLTNSK